MGASLPRDSKYATARESSPDLSPRKSTYWLATQPSRGTFRGLLATSRRQLDLDLYALRGHVRSEVKRGNGFLESKSVGNKGFDVDLASAHESQRPWEDMRIAKYALD